MIKSQLKFEGKIHYGLKVVAFTRNHTIFLGLKVKATTLKNPIRYLDDQYSVNSSSLQIKF